MVQVNAQLLLKLSWTLMGRGLTIVNELLTLNMKLHLFDDR